MSAISFRVYAFMWLEEHAKLFTKDEKAALTRGLTLKTGYMPDEYYNILMDTSVPTSCHISDDASCVWNCRRWNQSCWTHGENQLQRFRDASCFHLSWYHVTFSKSVWPITQNIVWRAAWNLCIYIFSLRSSVSNV